MTPYGTSSYRSAASAVEVSARRYRYTGKERDEETGLDYFGARHYAPWLGRWTSADPLGLQAGLNLYLYGRASPVVMVDPNGMQEYPPDFLQSYHDAGNEVPVPPLREMGKALVRGVQAAVVSRAAEITTGALLAHKPLLADPKYTLQATEDVATAKSQLTDPSTTPGEEFLGNLVLAVVAGGIGESAEGIGRATLGALDDLSKGAGKAGQALAKGGGSLLDDLGKLLFPNADELGELATANGAPIKGAVGAADDAATALSRGGSAAKAALKELDIVRYGEVNAPGRVGDDLAGHEVLQNAWLKQQGLAPKRGVGPASRDNPALVVGKELHAAIGKAQKALGLHDPSKLKGMSAARNVELNAQALLEAGVPEETVKAITQQALQHARNLGVQ